MNTRILRMIDRSPIETPNGPWRHPVWLVDGLGQLQPVLFGVECGAPTLRIEGMADCFGAPRACWHVLPLPHHKRKAKALFADLERHKEAGTRGPASQWWFERQTGREAA